ncbi:metalloregulator ArsR/SmtB family transcription factor [Actinomadura sp. DC4]|uniref:ArsR/SmtB family transcription factor n=1 Tax=Actinomadura sp. DC4 TaxID=3055069 RepID=UPI0025B06817|nr:metalloregulator ArsR/SmtB family transcription factor [Actinomadura sp. DC4]MDN3352044.1 metalloregulator ArsR/SmtB family transcription factor [Actinomadura sp. DC4]
MAVGPGVLGATDDGNRRPLRSRPKGATAPGRGGREPGRRGGGQWPDVFRAVADPTRRAVLEVLTQAGELTVTELAGRLDVGLPMLSRHLAVLREAGLVSERRAGRHRVYGVRPAPLRELFD